MSDKTVNYLILIGLVLFATFFFWFGTTQNRPYQITIGPNLPRVWHITDTLTLDGTYTVHGENYFEIQSQGSIIQSTLEPPQVGKSQGEYWIREANLSGNCQIQLASAEIYSNLDHQITITESGNEVFGVLAGLIFWCFYSMFISSFRRTK